MIYKLRDLVRLRKGKKAENNPAGIQENYVDMKFLRTGLEVKKSTGGVFVEDDLVILSDGEYQGYVNFARRGYLGSTLSKIEVPEKVHKKYLFYFLKKSYPIFKANPRGSGIPHLNQDVFKNLEINLPPLEEQIRIAQRLEEAERQSRSIQSESDRLLQDISDFRQEILTRAFRGDLTEQNFDEGTGQDLLKQIQLEREQEQTGKRKKKVELKPVEAEEEPYELPPNWTWTRLGEVASFINGDRGKNYPSKSHFVCEGVPFINAGDLTGNEVSKLKMNFISEKKFESLGNGKVQKQDILYCLRGTLGKMGVVKSIDKGAIASSLVIIRKVKLEMTPFVFYFLQSRDASELISRYDNGTAQPNLSAENVKKFTIPLPPLAEQERIVTKIEAIFSALDIMEDAIKKQKEEAKSCYEEILRKEMDKESEAISEEKEFGIVG